MCGKYLTNPTQEIFDKAVSACLPPLKFFSYWFVTNKILENIDNVVLFNDDTDDRDSDIILFSSNDIDLVTIGLNNVNFDGDNFDEDELLILFLLELLIGVWQKAFTV